VLKNPHVSSAITGASKVEQVYTAVKAVAVYHKLTDEIMKEVDDILGNKPAPLTRRF
jgi:aryl-alcohol dehydrogenase-like predicted oxidoreductase